MNRLMRTIAAAVVLFVLEPSVQAAEIVTIPLFDAAFAQGKLQLPAEAGRIKTVVIYIHGTGPGTYNNHRKIGSKEFNYFDLFGEEFNRRGIGFFTYSKRGVEFGDEAPLFDKVDREKFRQVVPSVEVKDIGSMITFLRKQPRLKNAKVILWDGAREV